MDSLDAGPLHEPGGNGTGVYGCAQGLFCGSTEGMNAGPLGDENPPFPCDVACAAAHLAAQSIGCCTPPIGAQCTSGGSFEVPQSLSICPNIGLENGCERLKAAHPWKNHLGLCCICDALGGNALGGSGLAVLWMIKSNSVVHTSFTCRCGWTVAGATRFLQMWMGIGSAKDPAEISNSHSFWTLQSLSAICSLPSCGSTCSC